MGSLRCGSDGIELSILLRLMYEPSYPATPTAKQTKNIYLRNYSYFMILTLNECKSHD